MTFQLICTELQQHIYNIYKHIYYIICRFVQIWPSTAIVDTFKHAHFGIEVTTSVLFLMAVAFDDCVAFCAFWNRKLQLELKQNHHIVQSQEILDHGAPKSLPKYNLICHLCWKQQSEGVAKIVLQILERKWTKKDIIKVISYIEL